jgi:hypothetical protein
LVGELRRPVLRAADPATREAAGFLPAHRAVQALLPWPGLRRGASVVVTGSTSLLFAVLAGGMRDGAWAAIVGIPALGLVAAAEHDGMDLSRPALVPHPGPDWPKVVAALIGGVDLLAVAPPAPPTAEVARMLAAKARQHGTVLIPTPAGWPGYDLHLDVTGRTLEGLGKGRGRLRRQRSTSSPPAAAPPPGRSVPGWPCRYHLSPPARSTPSPNRMSRQPSWLRCAGPRPEA